MRFNHLDHPMALYLWFTFFALGCMNTEACTYGDGIECVLPCHCMNDAACDSTTGACAHGCDDGGPSGTFWRGAWTGAGCQRGNVAYNKPAFQVGILSGSTNTADKAVDGDHHPDLVTGRHCSQPYSGSSSIDAWWYTDLQDLFIIDQLTIYNGNGWTANAKLSNTIIGIGTTNDIDSHTICARIDSASSQFDVVCDSPTLGRYVSLRRERTGQSNYEMNFCEIFVYGFLYRGITPATEADDQLGTTPFRTETAVAAGAEHEDVDNTSMEPTRTSMEPTRTTNERRRTYVYRVANTFIFVNALTWMIIFLVATVLAVLTNATWCICMRRSRMTADLYHSHDQMTTTRTRQLGDKTDRSQSQSRNMDENDRHINETRHQHNKRLWR